MNVQINLSLNVTYQLLYTTRFSGLEISGNRDIRGRNIYNNFDFLPIDIYLFYYMLFISHKYY